MEIRIWSVLLIFAGQQHSSIGLDSSNCSHTVRFDTVDYGLVPENAEMRFYLFTNLNKNNEQQLHIDDNASLMNSNFNKLWPTRFIIPGWQNSFISCTNAIIKEAYLVHGNFNVIVVDWGEWSENANYLSLTLHTNKIGQHIADFALYLAKATGISFDSIYLIGHSLGAQIAGAAGKLAKPNQFNTIFALDPAGPIFNQNNRCNRIDESDAKYVEAISTNMGELGYEGIVGHASFFPNYGREQKHCNFGSLGCSHYASITFFVESLNTKVGFCAVRCDYMKILTGLCDFNDRKVARMGGDPSVPKYGTFYLKTKASPPYAMGGC